MSHSEFNTWWHNPDPTPEANERFMIELVGYSAHVFDWLEHGRRVGESLVGKGRWVRDKPKPCRQQVPRRPDGLQDPSKAAGEPGLLTIDQAAAYLGITDDQVAAFVQDGELSYINVGRGKKRARYRFTIPDLQAVHRASQAEGSPLSVYKPKKSPFYHFDIQVRGRRFHGTTKCTTRKEAEAFEAVERDKAKALVKAMQRSRTSLLIDDVAAQVLGAERRSTMRNQTATSANLARLIEYFGKTKPLTDIDHTEAQADGGVAAWPSRQGPRRCAADLQCDRQPLDHQGIAAVVRLRQGRGRGVRARTEVG